MINKNENKRHSFKNRKEGTQYTIKCFHEYVSYIALTSKTGNKKRELPEKWVRKPRARFPIAWMASTATAMFTSVTSYKQKEKLGKS